MLIRCIDVETTGVPSPTTPQAIVECAWCDLQLPGAAGPPASNLEGAVISTPFSLLIDPGRPIPPEASAVHHITDNDVAGQPSPDAACRALTEGATMWCAHKADFESQFFGGKPLICTYKAALRIWPDAVEHKLQTLRYLHRLDDATDFVPELALPAHRAGPDAYVCAHLLRLCLQHVTLDKLRHWSSGPALLSRVTFGKHRGMKWSEVPTSYLDWLINKSDFDDRDTRATAKYYLTTRAAGQT